MKKVSGEFLSRLLWAVQQFNVAERSPEEVRQMLLSSLDAADLYVEVAEPAVPASGRTITGQRLPTFDAGNLERLNALLPWSSFAWIGDDAVLGAPWSASKRDTPARYPDRGVEQLNERLPLAGLSVLELGCFEGHHSISLARHAREVWGIDGRIENVIKTLVRVWMAGLERSVSVNLLDLERGTLKNQLESLGRSEPFDVVHHRGVLYHLSDPVANLVQCAEVTRSHLYLHTQIARDDQADSVLEHSSGRYDVFRYREPNIEFAPFAGITPHAHWMTRSSLERLLQSIGFAKVEVIQVIEERNGLRLELIASR